MKHLILTSEQMGASERRNRTKVGEELRKQSHEGQLRKEV